MSQDAQRTAAATTLADFHAKKTQVAHPAFVFESLMEKNEMLYQTHLHPVLEGFGMDPTVGMGLKWAHGFDAYLKAYTQAAGYLAVDSGCFAFGGWGKSNPPACTEDQTPAEQLKVKVDWAIAKNFVIKVKWLLKGNLLGVVDGIGDRVPLLSCGFLIDMVSNLSRLESALGEVSTLEKITVTTANHPYRLPPG